MAFLNDEALDGGLDWVVANGTSFHLCSSEPSTYGGISAVALGVKSGLTLTGPANGATEGRAITLPAISDGSVTATGTATHWALSDGTGVLVATGALASSQSLVSGSTFTTSAVALVNFDDAV